MKLNWNFWRNGEGGGFKVKTIDGGGMDILWNLTMIKSVNVRLEYVLLVICEFSYHQQQTDVL